MKLVLPPLILSCVLMCTSLLCVIPYNQSFCIQAAYKKSEFPKEEFGMQSGSCWFRLYFKLTNCNETSFLSEGKLWSQFANLPLGYVCVLASKIAM